MLRVMKTIAFAIVITLLLGAGCTSAPQGAYALTDRAQISDRIHHNSQSATEFSNRWKYAGSDDNYDYFYEYDQGDMYPNDFHFYKASRGEFQFPFQYAFDSNINSNQTIFDGRN